MKKNFLGAMVLLILILTLGLSGCGAILVDAAKLNEYEVDGETVPSINSIVGEREVTAVDTETNNGITSIQYTYKSTSVTDDLIAYLSALHDQYEWLVTEDYDLTVVPGTVQMGKTSQDEGKILILSVAYEDEAYAIKISKLEGTID